MPGLRPRLLAGNLVLSTMISEVTNPNVAAMLKVAGLDSFIVDMEHGIFDYPTMSAAVSLGRALGLAPVVRIPEIRKEPIQRALDAGASGILAPLVRTVDDVRQTVAFGRYPPLGQRGIALKRPHGAYANSGVGPYIAAANDEVAILVQIETREAFATVSEIAAVEGLDGLFIGPQDLSTTLGHVDAPWSDAMKDTYKVIAAAALAHHKALGMQTVTYEQAMFARQAGASYISCSGDVGMLTDGISEIPSKVREAE